MDKLDTRLISVLRSDPTATTRFIARQLGIPQSTVSNRLRGLRERRALQIRAAVELKATGFDLIILLGLRVSGPLFDNVTEKLAEIPEVIYLQSVSGDYDLSAFLVARNRSHLRKLENKVSRIEGIVGMISDIAVDVRRYNMSFEGKVSAHDLPLQLSEVDDTDRSIMKWLVADSAIAFSEIARREKLAIATVRSRIAKLKQRGVLHFLAVTDPYVVGRSYVAFVGLQVMPARLAAVASVIEKLDNVMFLSQTMSNYNLLALFAMENASSLRDLINKRILPLRGVDHTSTAPVISVLKFDQRWLLAPDRPDKA
jgi:DNA-binding Lrp family transcriptional regulator